MESACATLPEDREEGMSREVEAMSDDRSTECRVLYVRAGQLHVDVDGR